MASNSRTNWEDMRPVLWSVLKPALIAMIVALLVTLGVPRPGPGLLVQGVSHFSSVYSNDDLQAVDDVIAGDDLTVADDSVLTGDLAVSGTTTAVALTASGAIQGATLSSTGTTSVGTNLNVDGTSNLVGNVGSTTGAITMTDAVNITGAATLDSTLDVDGAITSGTGGITITDAVDIDGNLTSATGAITMSDDVKVTGGLTLDGLVSIGTFARVPAESGIVVTMNGYITPTGTLQAISAAGTVNTSNLAAGTAGDVLIMYNTSAQTINITDTGTIMLSANWAAGQYDTLWLWSDGTNWLEIGRSNN